MSLELDEFFKRVSTFEIRWKQTRFKDFISPGVTLNEFLDEFTRADLNEMIRDGLLMKKSYTPRSGRRSVVVYVGKLLPQVRPWPKRLERLKQSAWWGAPGAIVLLCFFFFFVLCAIAHFTQHVWAFSSAPLQPNLQGFVPNEATRGYFDDLELKVRCYWLKRDSVALSCVNKPSGK